MNDYFFKLIRTEKYLLWLMSILNNMFLSNQLNGFFANPPLCWVLQRVYEPRPVWLTNIIHTNLLPIIKRLLIFALSRVTYKHIMRFANPVVSPLRAHAHVGAGRSGRNNCIARSQPLLPDAIVYSVSPNSRGSLASCSRIYNTSRSFQCGSRTSPFCVSFKSCLEFPSS